MSKHQIAFVGGQLLPIYLGIKEFVPDKVHFIVSKETKNKASLIRSVFLGKTYSENVCEPFDFNSIKSVCEKVLLAIQEGDELEFNLTGGTKIMVLAAQAIINEQNLRGFYINQDNTFLQLPSYEIKNISSAISIKEFLEVSGHKLSSSKLLNDFSTDDFKASMDIEAFSLNYDKLFFQINSRVRNTYHNFTNIPVDGNIEVNKSAKLSWTGKKIRIEVNGKEIFKIQSLNSRTLFFNAAWWELIVAKEISRWSRAKELLVHCELPFKTDALTTKNEIDILINLGDKLIFVECKSGMVKQEDINKMRIIKDTYGGVISKSLLVSRFVLTPTILEKCRELNIEVFYCFMGKTQINQLGKLLNILDTLDKRPTI